MKGFVASILFCSVLIAGHAVAQDTALTALQTLTGEKGDMITKTLLQIRGEAGNPQPITWTITCVDATARRGIREYEITRGALAGERTPLQDAAITKDTPLLDQVRVKIDSDVAFKTINAESIRKKLTFHTINYALNNNASSEPIWFIRLFDNFGAHIVSAEISAESGSILKYEEVDPEARDRAQQSRDGSQSDSNEGGLFGRIRDVGENTGKRVNRTFLRVVGDVQEFLTGDRTVGENQESSQDQK